MDDEQTRSIWGVILLMLGIAAFGWVFAAAAYATELEGLRPSVGSLARDSFSYSLWAVTLNAFAQLRNFHSVIDHTVQKRIWLPIAVGVLEAFALALGLLTVVMEKRRNREG